MKEIKPKVELDIWLKVRLMEQLLKLSLFYERVLADSDKIV